MEMKDVGNAALERCQEHMVTDGEVVRSKKMNGVVERTRRCRGCGDLFKTFEMTDDKLAYRQAVYDERVMALKRELKYWKRVVEDIKAWYEAERTLKIALKNEYEFGNEDRD